MAVSWEPHLWVGVDAALSDGDMAQAELVIRKALEGAAEFVKSELEHYKIGPVEVELVGVTEMTDSLAISHAPDCAIVVNARHGCTCTADVANGEPFDPDECPECGAEWVVRSKTMGARWGQPHKRKCANGHWWRES